MYATMLFFRAPVSPVRAPAHPRPSRVQVVAARTVVSTEARLAAAGRRAAAEWVRANMGNRSGSAAGRGL